MSNFYNLILSLFSMKIASYIFTSLLILPVLFLLYIGYTYITDKSLNKELIYLYEIDLLSLITGCTLLFVFSLFLSFKKKYFENVVFFGCFILFLIIHTALFQYGKKNRAHIRHSLFSR